MHSGRFLCYLKKKGKIVKMITCCHSLSLVVFVVSCCTTRCHSLYHSLSLVVPIAVTRCTTRCHSMYHSLSLDVSLVCLFINNNQISLLCKNFHKLFVHFGMKENKMKTGQPWIHLLKVTKKKKHVLVNVRSQQEHIVIVDKFFRKKIGYDYLMYC